MRFPDDVIICKCGCGYIVKDWDQIEMMDRVYDLCVMEFGKEPVVTSWCRCEDHNAAVDGVPNSFHVQGIATDFYVPGVPIDTLGDLAKRAGANGVGRYYGDGFVHADTRGSDAEWAG